MDKRDIELIKVLQREDIYLTRSPFQAASELLGWDVGEVLRRAGALKEKGVIKRFGAALTPRKAGFKANAMVAWEVESERRMEAGDLMAAHPRISHCYIRPVFKGFPYSLYTMIHANSQEDLASIIEELSASTGISSYRAFRSIREFKKSSPVYFTRSMSPV